MSSAAGSSGSSAPPGYAPSPQRLHEALDLVPGEPDPVWLSTYEAIRACGLHNPRFIRRGSYGCILKAEDPKARCLRAVKVTLDPHSEPSAKAFEKEVSGMGLESLPGCICRLHWRQDSPDRSHQPFLILEWIDGWTIDEYVDGLGIDARVQLVPRFLDALASVHAHGMSLGDCSPGNTMVDRQGRVRFVDLGQAGDLRAIKRSRNSVGRGTPDYVSPSRLEGNRSRECDEMYAATCVVFTILTAEVPPELEQWGGRLDACGVPRPLALLVIEARRRAAAESAMAGASAEVTGSARKLANATKEWLDTSRRARSLSRWRVATVVTCVAAVLGFAELWQLYRQAVLSELWRGAESLWRQVDVIPNRSHRAVVAAIVAAKQERAQSMEDVGRDRAVTEAGLRRLQAELQGVLTLAGEVAALEPLLDCIGSVIEATPWLAPTVDLRERQADILRRYLSLRSSLDRGEVKEVWDGALQLQVALAQLTRDNAAAGRALRVRSDFRVLERQVPDEVRQTRAWRECAERADEAERLFASGQFEDRGAPGAYQEYSQALVALKALLGSRQSSTDEGDPSVPMDVDYLHALHERVLVAEARASAAEARSRLIEQRPELARGAADAGERGAPAATVPAAERKGGPPGERVAGGWDLERRAAQFVNGVGMTMVRIGARTFTMGSPESEADRDADEGQHAVSVEAHWISSTETTQEQWIAVMGSRPWSGKPHIADGDRFPAVWVDWDMVRLFLARLTQHEVSRGAIEREYEYRLPTEGEWELSARAGSTGSYCFGDDRERLAKYAWFDGNRLADHAAEVATRLPNAWGLYDCHGNVMEWCADAVEVVDGAVHAPSGDADRTLVPRMRAVRGGSFFLGDGVASECRSASRRGIDAASAHPYLGFRAVLARKQ